MTLEEFAAGVVRVVNATMEKAIRVVSIERGYDPRDFALVAFGGAGGLHACELAEALGIPRVIVPVLPGALSAFGILVSDVVKDYSRTVLWRGRKASCRKAGAGIFRFAPQRGSGFPAKSGRRAQPPAHRGCSLSRAGTRGECSLRPRLDTRFRANTNAVTDTAIPNVR